MTFKLIREAQATLRLGDKAQEARNVQKILGVDSITAIEEALTSPDMEVTPAHYNEWLRTVIDIAAERGVNLNKKTDFADVAFDLLDNDSFVDALTGADPSRSENVKQSIVNTLWQSYKVSKAHARAQASVSNAVQQAREEEQMAAMARGEQSGFEQAFDAAKGVEQEEIHRRGRTPMVYAAAKTSKTNPHPPGSFRAMMWDKAHQAGVEDEELRLPSEMPPEMTDQPSDVDTATMSPEELASHIVGGMDDDQFDDDHDGDTDIEARVDDLEARVDDLEQGSGSDKPADSAAIVGDGRRSYDDEEQVKQLFHKAITAPKDHLSSALKDVEKEGESAWSALQLPKNPHLKKSPAYKAWEKGMKAAARRSLGLVDRPVSPSRHSKKRK